MSQPPRPDRSPQQGFTLIEVIITLVVASILAVVLVMALGTSFTSSSEPIFRLQQTMALHRTMENIRADFSAANSLALLKLAIGTGVQSNGYGNYQVIDNGYITFTGYNEAPGIASDGILKVSIKDPGTGMVLTELFVQW